MTREKMKTIGGMSIRAEIDMRLTEARADARSDAFVEAIAFLHASGYPEAGLALDTAAFAQALPASAEIWAAAGEALANG